MTAPSSSRNGATVIWVTVHTAEGITKAEDLKAFFARATDRSAHAVADDLVLLEPLVPYDRAAWTLRNGNSRSDNLELCGFARWTRDEWLNNHRGMLNHAAAWVRSRCLARGIPIRKIGPTDVAAGKAGVIGHVDYTLGTHDGTHTDPGPGFPWDYVITRAAGQTTEVDVQFTDDLTAPFTHPDGTKITYDFGDWVTYTNKYVVDTLTAVAALTKKVNDLTAKVDTLVTRSGG